MEKYLLDVLINEIRNQCYSGIISYTEIGYYITYGSDSRGNQKNLHNYFWLHVSNLLNASAIVSKIIYGSGRDSKIYNERKTIRDVLEIPGDMTIKNKKFRNHFEHIDERIVDWAMESDDRNLADRNIGGEKSIVGFKDSDYLRNYDPYKNQITFKGEYYKLAPVYNDLKTLYDKANKYLGY